MSRGNLSRNSFKVLPFYDRSNELYSLETLEAVLRKKEKLDIEWRNREIKNPD